MPATPAAIAVTLLRLAFLRPTDTTHVPAGVVAVVLASAAWAGGLVALEWLDLRLAGVVRLWMDPAGGALFLATLLMAWLLTIVLAWCVGVPPEQYRRFGVTAMAASLVPLAAAAVALLVVGRRGELTGAIAQTVAVLWAVCVWVRAAQAARRARLRFVGRRDLARALGAFVVGTAAAAAISVPEWSFLAFIPAQRSETPRASLADEGHFHQHRAVLAEALGALAPGREGRPDLYFVGFAPDASDDVFVREMRSIRRFVDRRFGTAARSLLLINHRAALGVEPMASATQLQDTLTHLASIMNVDEDVLLMYVSTHGEVDGTWTMLAPPLRLQAMDGGRLRAMLDEAGIRWRILIVSACYSGTAIQALADPYTLIMTAADAKQPSFGCGNDLDFTFWGDALFNQAFPKTDDFAAAYDIAARYVRQRELRAGYQPSNPQMVQGDAIGLKLKELGLQWQLDRAEGIFTPDLRPASAP
jgi:Peptidase C13 family